MSDDEASRGQPLATVVDRDLLDAPDAKTGVVVIAVLPAWLERPGTLVFDVPKRVKCASCDGGGCGLCGNTGAFRFREQPPCAPLRIDLDVGSREPKRIRITSGFGEGGADLLLLELQPSEAASPLVRFEERSAPIVPTRTNEKRTPMWLTIAVLLALSFVMALLVRSLR